MLFTGEYEHTIDSKQRLAIPAELRNQLDSKEHGEAFFAVPGANGSLWLWPERTFERMASAMEQTLVPGEEALDFEELLFPQSRRVEIDKTGRIRIPEHMLSEFGLGETVMILGVKDHLELRDPKQWKEHRQQRLDRRKEIMLRARAALAPKSSLPRPRGGGGEEERP